jgi:putative pyrimidine permease RutG
LLANGFGLGKPIDFTALAAAPWIGLPKFTGPTFHADAMFLIAPVAIILVAENLGHIKAIGAMTGRSLDRYLGRAFWETVWRRSFPPAAAALVSRLTPRISV